VSAVPAYPIDSVDRALSLILALESAENITVSEAGKFLGVARSTAYRLLTVLEHRGFVVQDRRTKAFHAGPALLRVGLAAVRRSDIRIAVRPLLEDIVADVNETAHLVVLLQNDALYLDCVESSLIIRATPREGSTLPAHLSASGKVLLANLPPARLDEFLAPRLPGMTRKSKTSAASVRRELAGVAKNGWAINDEETEPGLRAVAVLVPAERTRTKVDAAITVAGPASRLDLHRLEDIARTMLDKVEHFEPAP
jgi:IclR family transcriptional regulator, acetate operon repressor